jgi:hypothetical protein
MTAPDLGRRDPALLWAALALARRGWHVFPGDTRRNDLYRWRWAGHTSGRIDLQAEGISDYLHGILNN